MAKNSLPSVDGAISAARSIRSDMQLMEEIRKATEAVRIAVDDGESDDHGYIPRNVDVRMSRVQAKVLRDTLRALQDAGAKTANGKFVDNRAQAVRWILECLA